MSKSKEYLRFRRELEKILLKYFDQEYIDIEINKLRSPYPWWRIKLVLKARVSYPIYAKMFREIQDFARKRNLAPRFGLGLHLITIDLLPENKLKEIFTPDPKHLVELADHSYKVLRELRRLISKFVEYSHDPLLAFKLRHVKKLIRSAEKWMRGACNIINNLW